MSGTAIIAGEGRLPAILADYLPGAPVYALDGFSPAIAARAFRLERLVPLIDELCGRGVTQVVFAGSVRRPRLDPQLFDPATAQLVPRILAAMQSGDDTALREVIAIFEESGLAVIGVDQIAPDLLPGPGLLAGTADPQDQADAARAAAILSGMGHLDIGQGAVVAGGLCLAVETLPGTAAMLDFVAHHRGGDLPAGRRRGVFYKAPKPGQDRRIDLPALGPDSVAQAAAAGLAGIAWQAGGVLVLDRDETVAAADDAGVFLWSRP